jgi:hypothetical protein
MTSFRLAGKVQLHLPDPTRNASNIQRLSVCPTAMTLACCSL